MKKIVIILSCIIFSAAQQKQSVDIRPGVLYDRVNDTYANPNAAISAGNSSYNTISSHATVTTSDVNGPITVTTFAGSGTIGSANGTGTEASFNRPSNLTWGKGSQSGNLLVADIWNYKIRSITSSGVVSDAILLGSDAPTDMAYDSNGNLFIVGYNEHKIYKLKPTDSDPTIFAGSGTSGSADGTGTEATFYYPWAIEIDSNDNLFVSDHANHLIRKITPGGVVTTFAGSGSAGSADGTGTAATFNTPTGLSFDSSGNLFVADWLGHNIRKITPSGVVTTFAGSGSMGPADGTGTAASFYRPLGIAIDNGNNLYIGDSYNNKIRKITSAGVVTTLAGSGTAGSADGTGTEASFKTPYGIEMGENNSTIYVADFGNHSIRKIVFNATPAIASISDVTIKEDETATVTLSATDAESDPITFSVKNNVASNYLNFDGVDDWIQTKNASGEEDHPIPDEGEFSVSVWARANASASGLMEIYSQGKQPRNIYLGSSGGESEYIRAGDSWGNTGVAFPIDGMWHHYVITKSSSNTYLYLDGELAAAKGRAIDNPNPEGSGLYIGKQYGTAREYFDGNIAELSVWEAELSATEIKTIYNSGLFLSPMRDTLDYSSADDVSIYYPLNEGTGSTVQGTEYNSSEAFTGEIKGGAEWTVIVHW